MSRAAKKSSTRSAGKRPSITDLYNDFEAAFAAANALPAIPAGQSTKPFDDAVQKCTDIAWKIVKAPARDTAEMLLKIQTAAWCSDVPYKQLEDWHADNHDEEALHALATLREDLLRLQARG